MHCWVTCKCQHCALGHVSICLSLCGSYMCRHTDHTVHVTRGCLSFRVTHKDKDAPWGWHIGAETCRSPIVMNIYWRDPVHSVDFYTLYSVCCVLSTGWFAGVWSLYLRMELTECPKILAYKLQTLANHPEESIQHLECGEILKSTNVFSTY
jgi:hypothetical protein